MKFFNRTRIVYYGDDDINIYIKIKRVFCSRPKVSRKNMNLPHSARERLVIERALHTRVTIVARIDT